MRIEKEFIFTDAPTPQCHASTLLPLPGGGLLAAWFGGQREGAEDVTIWVSRREAGLWSPPLRIAGEEGTPHWNPVLFAWDGGTVALFFKVGRTIPLWRTMVCFSDDGGRSWSLPRELVPGDETGGRGPVKNKPIRTGEGRILAPASRERAGSQLPGAWRAFVDIYTGSGWQKHPIPAEGGVNMIQPTLWESRPGKIHALLRTNGGRIYRSDSRDGGLSWCTAYPTALPNNNSGLDAVMLPGDTLALVCNPVEADWGLRTPLTLFLSEDNGATFTRALELETGEGEYSYPAVTAAGARLYISYTWRRERIACCTVEVEG